MTEDRRAKLAVVPSASLSSVADMVTAGVPESFRIPGDVVDFGVDPWRALAYAYSCRPAARVNVSALPEAMHHELAWWLHSLHVGGERVNSHVLASWVKIADGVSADSGRPARSFVDLSVVEWMAAARTSFYGRHGRLPGVTFEQNYRATIARLRAAVARCYDTGEWWRADLWDPRRDPRIPRREHEALGNARLNFERVAQPWLADAIKWYFAVSLETGNLVWSSLPSALTYLGSYLSEFLVDSGIDTPALVADPEVGLRTVALAFLGDLRQRRSRRGRPLTATSVGLIQSGVSSFYAFMADHRVEAARALGEPRWAELSDAHARLWRAGEYLRRDRPRSGGDYIDPAALSRIVEHLDILALAKDQTKTVMVDGVPAQIAGVPLVLLSFGYAASAGSLYE